MQLTRTRMCLPLLKHPSATSKTGFKYQFMSTWTIIWYRINSKLPKPTEKILNCARGSIPMSNNSCVAYNKKY